MFCLPSPLTTVKCVLLAIDAVSICFGAVTTGGCMEARFARFAAVKSSVPEAALYKWNQKGEINFIRNINSFYIKNFRKKSTPLG